jgi:sterol desaturase/sphingolipid hydroxylase (fatty acid hydroxylase superfamily)
MHRETAVQLSLVGLFIVLALLELAFRHPDEPHEQSGDGRLLTNFGLTGLGLVLGGLFPLARIGSSLVSQRFGIGVGNFGHLPWTAILLATLLLDSLVSYWAHRLMHSIPLLWRVHRVHHADTAVDVSTSLRNHPLELLVTVPASALVVIVIGASPSVILAIQSTLIAAALWQHADLALPPALDRALSAAIVTPRLHRVHHSRERDHHDRNFGDSIILWDRLFGTFDDTAIGQAVGLENQRARADHLIDQLCSPLYSANRL